MSEEEKEISQGKYSLDFGSLNLPQPSFGYVTHVIHEK
jgi:hypothetical protein